MRNTKQTCECEHWTHIAYYYQCQQILYWSYKFHMIWNTNFYRKALKHISNDINIKVCVLRIIITLNNIDRSAECVICEYEYGLEHCFVNLICEIICLFTNLYYRHLRCTITFTENQYHVIRSSHFASI